MNRLQRVLMICGLYLIVSACTYVPFDTPKETTRALPSDGTNARKVIAELTGTERQQVAVAPLFDGNDALGARLRMIETAERSIDLQTFLIKPDMAGSLIWLALYSAAERGVMIRLLFDDVFTQAHDDQIAALNAHSNVDIRVFNPLSRNSPVAVNFALDFARVNRRMHNKIMITDGSFAIVGGRNIADEYFSIDTKHDFADFDLFVAGRPVQELADSFDIYWNDAWSLPFAAIADADVTPLSEAYAQFRNRTLTQETEIYDRARNSTYIRQLQRGQVPVYFGAAQVISDDPEKLRTPPGIGPFHVGDALYSSLGQAQDSVTIISPYFIPEEYGANYLENLARRGVKVTVVTNSLASTNHSYTHGHYVKYRKRLLQAGVLFAELRSVEPTSSAETGTPLTLHTKLALVDDTYLFAGSTNVDPRSIRQNTEIGMLIHSPKLAREIQTQLNAALPIYAYTVSVDETGDTVFSRPQPAVGFWRKLVSTVSGWLPIERQL